MLTKYKEKLDRFCDEAKDLYGAKLRSVVLYGSIVSGEYIKHRSNINVLIVLDKANFDMLTKSLGLVHKWRKKLGIFSLIMDMDNLGRCIDTFPIEFLDMKENYRILYGIDVLKDAKINLKHLKCQCEMELKGKVIRLRQGYLEAGLSGPALDVVITDSVPGVIAVFRAILRLKGKTPPIQKEQVIKAIAEEFHFNEDIGLRILDVRNGKEKLYSKAKEVLFRDWLFELETLSKELDDILKNQD